MVVAECARAGDTGENQAKCFIKLALLPGNT